MQGKKITDDNGVVTKVDAKTGEILEITFPLMVRLIDGSEFYFGGGVAARPDGQTLVICKPGAILAWFAITQVQAVFNGYTKCQWIGKWAKGEKRYTTKGAMKCSTSR